VADLSHQKQSDGPSADLDAQRRGEHLLTTQLAERNEKWWLTPSLQGVYAAETGPSTWPRAPSVASMTASTPLPAVTVTHVHVGLQDLSFHVSRIGVPMLVKISYYPRWHVSGATGPYRVSPNLMVVVPTSKDVSLNYTVRLRCRSATPSVTSR